MDALTLSLTLVTLLLAAIAGALGFSLLGQQNYLLGGLWLILAFSALNFLLFGLSGELAAYNIAYLCDAFCRGIGVPVLATAGLMASTHRYRPSARASLIFMSAVLLGAALLGMVDTMSWLGPCIRIGSWAGFSIYLWHFAKRLAGVGEHLHAVGVAVALFGAQLAMVSAGVVEEDHSERLRYYILESVTASYLCLELFYAYRALERSVLHPAT